ncbi:hypothetical protein [Pelagibacterium sp.]|uniref:hypothetical protein n=1 Tax=Pelagibacterium sp. TaxID=1967288 RepID=UPI003A9036E4
MPRTHAETMQIAALAESIGYAHPAAELEPAGRMYEDAAWNDLVDWFRENTDSWSDAVRVYCATRFGQSIEEVSIAAEGWIVSTAKRLEREDEPDAVVWFN